MRDKKTVKRIITGVKVDESEISPKTKKIKNFEKAQIVEKLKTELAVKMSTLAPEIHYTDNMDATKIASKIVKQKKAETLEFFGFARMWMARRDTKSMRNYSCMLNKLEEFLKRDSLDFSEITYTLLKDFEDYLSDFTFTTSVLRQKWGETKFYHIFNVINRRSLLVFLYLCTRKRARTGGASAK